MHLTPADTDALEQAMAAALARRGEKPGPGLTPPGSADPALAGMSAPASPADYRIDLPAGFTRDAALEENLRQWCHRAGLPQGIVAGIVSQYCRQAGGLHSGGAQPTAELSREWGEDFPRRIEAARAVLRRSGGGTELDTLLNRTGLGDDAWLIRALSAFGQCQQGGGGKA